ncbi:MAG TPA: DUF4433 domain-containing protein [Longimicrobium sp.]|nr:DUF4433 domain-containing protein [Longimicrobium sp.]
MLPLSREKARIFRITHVDNLPWILEHGVACRSSGAFDPGHRNIGDPELIAKRTTRDVPIAPGGTLSDYVPFYFTSRSPMLLNVKTGRNVPTVPMRDIMILVSSLPHVASHGIPFVFTDRHAYLAAARFSADLADLDRIDWEILRGSDFQYDVNDPGKMDRYQAEALIHDRVPVAALMGIVCHDDVRRERIAALVTEAGYTIPVVAQPRYYF